MWLWSGVVLAALALAACDDARNRIGGGEPGAAPGARVDAIKETPERYYGKTVRLAGEVDEIYGDRAFELEGNEWAFDDNITVLTKTPVGFGGAALNDDDEVVVVGKVRPFVAADVERDVGWDISPDVEIKLTKRPVIVAESIRKVGDPARWPPGGSDPVTSTLMIVATTEPWILADRKVDLRYERVQSVMGKGLWVGPSHMSQVFVLPNQPPKDVQPGEWVRVTGTMKKAPKDAVSAWDLRPGMEGVVGEDTVFVDDATVTEVGRRAAGPGMR